MVARFWAFHTGLFATILKPAGNAHFEPGYISGIGALKLPDTQGTRVSAHFVINPIGQDLIETLFQVDVLAISGWI